MTVASLLTDLRPPEKCLKEGAYTPEEFRKVWRLSVSSSTNYGYLYLQLPVTVFPRIVQ